MFGIRYSNCVKRQRREKDRGGRAALPARSERHERQEPRQVLGREHLAEDGERADGRRPGGDVALVVVGSAPEHPGDHEHERDREQRGEHADRVGGEAAEVDRAGLPLDPALVVDAELRAGEQDRGAEALDLQVALQLRPEAEADAPGREQEEGEHEHGAGDEEGGAGTRQRPDAPDRDRHHDRRIELHRGADAEQGAGRPLAGAQERHERDRGEQRRHGVVAVEEHGAHEDRRQDERGEPPRAQPEPSDDPAGAAR